MKTANEIYSEESYGYCDYQPILDEIGEIVIQVDDNDYQGDSRVLYKNGDKYGYLIFGWGSCSGCDALQACETIQEVQVLMDGLVDSVSWKSKGEMLKFFKSHDWEGDYAWHAQEQKEFISLVVDHLEKD